MPSPAFTDFVAHVAATYGDDAVEHLRDMVAGRIRRARAADERAAAALAAATPTHKRCPTCGKTKLAAAFHRSSSRADGLAGRCRGCHAAIVKAKRAQAPTVVPDSSRCSSCEQTKPAAAFHRNRARPDGLNNICKACRARQAARRPD